MITKTRDAISTRAVPALDRAAPRRISRLGVVLVLAVAVYAGLVLYGDAGALVASMRRVSPSAALLALALSTCNFAVRYVRWSYYLRKLKLDVPAGESALVFVAGFSMALTPMRAGELLKSLLLEQTRGVPIARSAPILVAERVTDLAALVLLAALGSLAFENGALLCGLGAFGVGVICLACAYRPLGETLLALAARIGPARSVLPRLREAYAALWALTGPCALLVGLALGVLAWGLQCLSLYVIAGAFAELALSPATSAFVYSAPLLAGTLAMLPGALLVTEASMTGLMLELGGSASSPAAAAAVTLIVRLLCLWWGVLVGFGALLVFRVRHGGERVHAAPAARAQVRS